MATTLIGGLGGDTVTAGSASWLDPRLVQALAPPVRTVVTLPAGVTVRILPDDSSRVAFVVIKASALGSFPRIGPGGLAPLFSLREDMTVDVMTFTLTDWLTLICLDWYATSTAGGDIEVWEFKPRF